MNSSTVKRILVVVIIVIALAISLSQTIKARKVGGVTYCTHGEIVRDSTRTAISLGLAPLKDDVVKLTKTCDKHAQFDRIYREALDAFTRGDTTKGYSYVERLKKLDSTFSPDELVKKANRSRQPGEQIPVNPAEPKNSEGAKPTESVSPGTSEKPFTGNDLTIFLPTSVPGYKGQSREQNSQLAARFFEATTKERVVSFIATVRKYSKGTGARNFISKVNKVGYPNSRRTTPFRGTTAYFGTNGFNYAALAWTQSNISFEIIMTSATNNPSNLLSDSMKIASYFPKRSF